VALEVSGTFLVELTERLANSGPPVLTPRPVRRELVATALTEAFVLLCVLAFCSARISSASWRRVRLAHAEAFASILVAWSRSWFRTHDPEGDVLDEPAFDASRRAFPDAVGIDEHSEYEGWVVGSTTATVLAVLGIERAEVELGHLVEHEEGEVVLREPVISATEGGSRNS